MSSFKSRQQRGFSSAKGGFIHSRREVYGTGLEITFTIELVGFVHAGMDQLEKAKKDLNVKIEKNR